MLSFILFLNLQIEGIWGLVPKRLGLELGLELELKLGLEL